MKIQYGPPRLPAESHGLQGPHGDQACSLLVARAWELALAFDYGA